MNHAEGKPVLGRNKIGKTNHRIICMSWGLGLVNGDHAVLLYFDECRACIDHQPPNIAEVYYFFCKNDNMCNALLIVWENIVRENKNSLETKSAYIFHSENTRSLWSGLLTFILTHERSGWQESFC